MFSWGVGNDGGVTPYCKSGTLQHREFESLTPHFMVFLTIPIAIGLNGTSMVPQFLLFGSSLLPRIPRTQRGEFRVTLSEKRDDSGEAKRTIEKVC